MVDMQGIENSKCLCKHETNKRQLMDHRLSPSTYIPHVDSHALVILFITIHMIEIGLNIARYYVMHHVCT